MGACCGGMKTSHQHKSLPEKNKAAAAVANEQQLNNDAVAVKNATSSVEGEETQPNNVDEQQEIATKTTSLETCPSVPLKQNGTQPDAPHGNHVDAELQQQSDVQQVEEPDLLVALTVASVSAEAPTVGVDEPEVTVSEDLVEAVAANVDLVACEPPSTGDEAVNEEAGVDTIQLRISEDGDLEKSAAAETSTVNADDNVVVEEGYIITESTTSVEATCISVSDVAPDQSDIISVPISQEQKTDVDAAVVDEQIQPTVEEGVEVAVPYQPEVVHIEEAEAVETSPELPVVPTAIDDSVTQESIEKVPQDVTLEDEIPVTQSETIIEQSAEAAATVVEPKVVTVDVDLPPPVEVQSTSEEVGTTVDVLLESSTAYPDVVQINDEVTAAASALEQEATLESSAPEISTVSESIEAEAASSDVPVVDEEKSAPLVTDDSAVETLLEQRSQPSASVDGELQPKEEEPPVETVSTEELTEPVEVPPPVEAVESAESVTLVTADSVDITATPDAAVDAPIDPIDPIIDENQQQQSHVEEAVYTGAVLETAAEVVSEETTSEPVVISAQEQITEQGYEGEKDHQRLVKPDTPEQPETIIEEITAQVDEAATDINVPPAPVQPAETPLQADTEPSAYEFEETNSQVGNVQPEDVSPEATASADQTPVTSDDTIDLSLLPPPPPADEQFLSESIEPEVEQQSPVVVDQGDDALPPPPPSEELSIDQQATPAATADELQEPPSPGAADDSKVATTLGDSGVSLAVYSPDGSTVSPTGSEDSSSSVADNASPSEIPSSTTLPSSQEASILSEA